MMTKPSYYKGPKNVSLKHMTVGNLIDQTAEMYPNREAIVAVQQNRKITFSELKYEVCTVQYHLIVFQNFSVKLG